MFNARNPKLAEAQAAYTAARGRSMHFHLFVDPIWANLTRWADLGRDAQMVELSIRVMRALASVSPRDAETLTVAESGLPSMPGIVEFHRRQKAVVLAGIPAYAEYLDEVKRRGKVQEEAEKAKHETEGMLAMKTRPPALREELQSRGIILSLDETKKHLMASGRAFTIDEAMEIEKFAPQIIAMLQAEIEAAKPRLVA